jgi:hypothetical protein
MDTKKPLNQSEASLVKTVFEDKGIKMKYRVLTHFSPETIARRFNLSAVEIAKAAGRKEADNQGKS